MIKDPT
jgi:hypothetical protein